MPLWHRIPKGTYVRPTPDWYAHQRARVAMFIDSTLTPPEYPAVALVNNSTANVNLHVIGISVTTTTVSSIYGKFITPPLPIASSTDFTVSSPMPLYSTDAMPPGFGVVGKEPKPTFDDAINLQGTNPVYQWFPPWEIAVIAPMTALELYGDEIDSTIAVMIDYIWMQD